MVKVCNHVSFTRLMSYQIRTVISTMVLVTENLNLAIITTQIHFAIDITNKTQNFQNTSGNCKTKASTSNVKWSVAAYASTYRCGSRRYDLCLTEKYVIARANHTNLLNKRTELISKCRHKNNYILKNIK